MVFGICSPTDSLREFPNRSISTKNKDSSRSESIKTKYKFPKPPVRDGCSMCRVLVGYGSIIAH